MRLMFLVLLCSTLILAIDEKSTEKATEKATEKVAEKEEPTEKPTESSTKEENAKKETVRKSYIVFDTFEV